VLLSGMVDHFPDPSRCAAEVGRVVRRRGRFMAFDPNRMNPVMWLYRDDASPFYSPVGGAPRTSARCSPARSLPCSHAPAWMSPRTISPGWLIATSPRRVRGCPADL
jgi:hypothetical protein